MTESSPPRAPRVRSPLLIISACIAATALAAVVWGLSQLEGLLRARAIDEARAQGIVMTVEDVDVGFDTAVLHGVAFELVGVTGFSGTAQRVDLVLDGVAPRALSAENVSIRLSAAAQDLILDVGAWAARYPAAFGLPLTARPVELSWTDGAAPWLTVAGGAIDTRAGQVRLEAARASAMGVEVGKVGATWRSGVGEVVFGFGESELDSAPLRMTLNHAATPPTAELTLARTRLSALSGPMAVALNAPTVEVSGKAALTFEGGSVQKGPVRGRLETTLHGFVPPHPIELDGFGFGDATHVSTDLGISDDRHTVLLAKTRVRAGKLKLNGRGVIAREAAHATLSLDLLGNLSCAALAESAARAQAGSVLGALAGMAAKAVSGGVGITVKVRADSRHLEKAAVDPTIGIGCGIGPLTVPDLVRLGLPPSLGELRAKLPGLPAGLDGLNLELPNEIPRVLPKLSLPKPPKLPRLPARETE